MGYGERLPRNAQELGGSVSGGAGYGRKPGGRTRVDTELMGHVQLLRRSGDDQRHEGTGVYPEVVNGLDAAPSQVQRKAQAPAPAGDPASIVNDLPTMGGAPLDATVRSHVEATTGSTVASDVQVHTGSESQQAAAQLGARAFTVGQNIHLAAGESSSDSKLMRHETVHTIQQQTGAGVRRKGVSDPGDAEEQEADRVAEGSADENGGIAAGGGALVARAPAHPEKADGSAAPRGPAGLPKGEGEWDADELFEDCLHTYGDLKDRRISAIRDLRTDLARVGATKENPPIEKRILAAVGQAALTAAFGLIGGGISQALLSQITTKDPLATLVLGKAIGAGALFVETNFASYITSKSAGIAKYVDDKAKALRPDLQEFFAAQMAALEDALIHERTVLQSWKNELLALPDAEKQMMALREALKKSFDHAEITQKQLSLDAWQAAEARAALHTPDGTTSDALLGAPAARGVLRISVMENSVPLNGEPSELPYLLKVTANGMNQELVDSYIVGRSIGEITMPRLVFVDMGLGDGAHAEISITEQGEVTCLLASGGGRWFLARYAYGNVPEEELEVAMKNQSVLNAGAKNFFDWALSRVTIAAGKHVRGS